MIAFLKGKALRDIRVPAGPAGRPARRGPDMVGQILTLPDHLDSVVELRLVQPNSDCLLELRRR